MTFRLASLLLPVLAGVAAAQPPFPAHGPPKTTSPLLFVQFNGPPGVRVAFYQGGTPPRVYPAPAVVGMRPGYTYRVGVAGFPGLPEVQLFPSVEVRGTLTLPPTLPPPRYPVPVNLTPADVETVLAGNLLTRVVYLEDPDRAEPVASRPGEILETELPPSSDLVAEARRRGRVMLVIRLGQRVPAFDEVLHEMVPGTLLLPGERVMRPAAAPPALPVSPWPFYDPRLGPKPCEEECLHDGGDRGPRAVFGPGGRLVGLDPEDTVAEFTASNGLRGITCSNRVCLCVPRFVALRCLLPVAGVDSVVALNDTRAARAEFVLKERVPSVEARQAELLAGYRGRSRPGVNLASKGPGLFVNVKPLLGQELRIGLLETLGTQEVLRLTEIQRAELRRQVELARELSGAVRASQLENTKGTFVIGQVEGMQMVIGSLETRDLTVCCQETPKPPDKPLVLVKCADRTSAQVGDVVTFTLKYSNHGGRPITDIAISDSLSARLEYLEGSAETDRDALFTFEENEVGSARLRWDVAGALQPGQSGRLRFKARVR